LCLSCARFVPDLCQVCARFVPGCARIQYLRGEIDDFVCQSCARIVPGLCQTCARFVPGLCQICAVCVPDMCDLCARAPPGELHVGPCGAEPVPANCGLRASTAILATWVCARKANATARGVASGLRTYAGMTSPCDGRRAGDGRSCTAHPSKMPGACADRDLRFRTGRANTSAKSAVPAPGPYLRHCLRVLSYGFLTALCRCFALSFGPPVAVSVLWSLASLSLPRSVLLYLSLSRYLSLVSPLQDSPSLRLCLSVLLCLSLSVCASAPLRDKSQRA
jgi:hypothetical protein